MTSEVIAMRQVAAEPAKRPGLHMVVIGAGLPRTGTTSCWIALQKLLNAACYHQAEAVAHHVKHMPVWSAQAPGEPLNENTIRILEPYRAGVGMPVLLHWKQLLAINPDAKVLLTVRDTFDDWYESADSTVYEMARVVHQMPWYAAMFDPMAKTKQVMGGLWGPNGLFQGRFEDKDFAKQVYEQYIEDVKRNVPKDQLLVFNVKDGWEPLCKFLGVPVPNVPFPHVNNRAFFQTRLLGQQRKKLWQFKYGLPLLLAGATACAAVFGARLARFH